MQDGGNDGWVEGGIGGGRGEIEGAIGVGGSGNRLLRVTSNATGVEAKIGRMYKAEGLRAANAWIEENLRPRMEQRLHKLRSVHPHHGKK